MINQEPLVSVIMNCYNGEKYLRQAIDSVLSQTHQNWEIIFWDNQSSDNSAEIVKSYNDSRIKYLYAPVHTLLYEARNYAIEQASGEYLAFLDVDDWWKSEKLEKQIALFDDPQVGLVAGNYWVVSERKKKQWMALKPPIATGWVLNDILKNYYVGLLTLMVRRVAFDSLDYPCNPKYHIIGDFDLVVRLLTKWKLEFVQEAVAFYRAHDNNETKKHRKRHVDELEKWLDEMRKVEVIAGCEGFANVEVMTKYIKAMELIIRSNKIDAFQIIKGIPLGIPKFRLITALILPSFIFLKLKS